MTDVSFNFEKVNIHLTINQLTSGAGFGQAKW